jgi:serine/threonine protein phosphatase PrpC
MKLSLGTKTDPGPRKGTNQDNALVVISPDRPDFALAIVADGMGGHRSGEEASAEAVRAIHEHLVERGSPREDEVEDRLCEAIRAANASIHHIGTTSPEMEGMGCTVVVALVIGDQFWVASVGDSRAYLIRRGELVQLTQDHTWVNARVQEGVLTQEQADTHMLRHVLDRALGPEPEVEVDCWPAAPLEAGDILVLCTDGLHGVLADDAIFEGAMAAKSAQQVAEELVARALAAPAEDNVTVAVIKAAY